VSGIVTSAGSLVKGFSIGDHVCAHVRMGGAFAQEIAITPNYAVAHLPAGVDFAVGAAFPLAYGTALEALRDRARLSRGETLLVLGAAGGVGIAAIQLAKVLGARVIAAASSDARLELCLRCGADAAINYETQDLREAIRTLTEGRGLDVVCDQIGGTHAEPVLRSMAVNGRYCVIGFASGAIPKIPLNLVLLKGCSIVGVAIGINAVRGDPAQYRKNFLQLLEWIASGQLAPAVTAQYALERTPDALNDLLNRKIRGKAIIVP
jgi:NADPH2:quinone reductase